MNFSIFRDYDYILQQKNEKKKFSDKTYFIRIHCFLYWKYPIFFPCIISVGFVFLIFKRRNFIVKCRISILNKIFLKMSFYSTQNKNFPYFVIQRIPKRQHRVSERKKIPLFFLFIQKRGLYGLQVWSFAASQVWSFAASQLFRKNIAAPQISKFATPQERGGADELTRR